MGGQIDPQAKLLCIFSTTHAIVMILFVSNVFMGQGIHSN